MAWNYRMARELVPASPGSDETIYQYSIREVYYDGSGNVNGWTEEHITPSGDTWADLMDDLGRMFISANVFPVLDLDTREWITPNKEGK